MTHYSSETIIMSTSQFVYTALLVLIVVLMSMQIKGSIPLICMLMSKTLQLAAQALPVTHRHHS